MDPHASIYFVLGQLLDAVPRLRSLLASADLEKPATKSERDRHILIREMKVTGALANDAPSTTKIVSFVSVATALHNCPGMFDIANTLFDLGISSHSITESMIGSPWFEEPPTDPDRSARGQVAASRRWDTAAAAGGASGSEALPSGRSLGLGLGGRGGSRLRGMQLAGSSNAGGNRSSAGAGGGGSSWSGQPGGGGAAAGPWGLGRGLLGSSSHGSLPRAAAASPLAGGSKLQSGRPWALVAADGGRSSAGGRVTPDTTPGGRGGAVSGSGTLALRSRPPPRTTAAARAAASEGAMMIYPEPFHFPLELNLRIPRSKSPGLLSTSLSASSASRVQLEFKEYRSWNTNHNAVGRNAAYRAVKESTHLGLQKTASAFLGHALHNCRVPPTQLTFKLATNPSIVHSYVSHEVAHKSPTSALQQISNLKRIVGYLKDTCPYARVDSNKMAKLDHMEEWLSSAYTTSKRTQPLARAAAPGAIDPDDPSYPAAPTAEAISQFTEQLLDQLCNEIEADGGELSDSSCRLCLAAVVWLLLSGDIIPTMRPVAVRLLSIPGC
ncbi:hypothetical protein CHLRE_15g634566v5 [Chlamydomonas reinhardtii]|uniref:Uncharacterized protein n=1 Tax=Chlamydomonas reinhardtii TaxID=3055 RepID=A0A2K3CWB3_CHLRE|nr:uncharacterized protein CHLRE_15g634566v5 [Chlamydomonas reinhardtii]PNW72573.1 hypothetical protein CHLRE_15g634566v5 [Chlamydomonas reinhardtii]